LQALQAQQIAIREYQYTPLVQIQKWSAVQRGLPLFESVVVFENYPTINSDTPNIANSQQEDKLKLARVRLPRRNNYPLSIVVIPDNELVIELLYDKHRFTEREIVRTLNHFAAILQGIINHDNPSLATLQTLLQETDVALDVEESKAFAQASGEKLKRSKRKKIRLKRG
jgi:transcriptional regulator with XRE-family HTH domain